MGFLPDFNGLLANQGTGGNVKPPTTAVPTLTGFLPISGARGSSVVLTGTGFTGTTLVSVNSGAVASFTVDSATQITAVLSSAQTTGKVRVTTPGGTATSTGDFTVQSAAPSFGTPVGLAIAPQSTGALTSNWNTTPQAVSYDFQRALAADFSSGTVILKSDLPTTRYSDLDVAVGTMYYYRVRAVKADGTRSDWSAGVGATAPVLQGISLKSLGILDDVASLDMGSRTYGSDQSEALQQIFATHTGLIEWDAKCSFRDDLLLQSGTRIIGKNGGGFLRFDYASPYCFGNKNRVGWAVDGNGSLVEGTLGTIVDEDITIEGLIWNMNGRVQDHDSAPSATSTGGWTIGGRFAGVRRLTLRNNIFRDQATFCAMNTNCEDVVDDNNLVQAFSKDLKNTDGIKYIACRGVRMLSVSGVTGDDMRSLMSSDGFFPSYPPPQSSDGASQSGYDKWAVYGDVTGVTCGTVDLLNTGFGFRIGSITNNAPTVKDVVIDEIRGVGDQHAMLIDTYEDKAAFYGPATGIRTGSVGDVRIKKYTYEMLSPPGQLHKPGNIYANVVQNLLRIDLLSQTRFDANNAAKLYVASEANIATVQIDSLIAAPTTADQVAYIKVAGRVGHFILNAANLDRSAFAADNGSLPLLEMQPGGRIDKLTIQNLTARNNLNLISIPNGSIGEIELLNIDAPATKLIYLPPGGTIDKITANSANVAAMVIGNGSGVGTVTATAGDYYYLGQVGSYEETSRYVIATSGWQSGAGAYHSGGACLYTHSAADVITLRFSFSTATTLSLTSGTSGDWGKLVLLLDGQPLAIVDQSLSPGAFHTTYTSASIPAGPHTLTAHPLADGPLVSFDGFSFS